jgi:hypothetical protein
MALDKSSPVFREIVLRPTSYLRASSVTVAVCSCAAEYAARCRANHQP